MHCRGLQILLLTNTLKGMGSLQCVMVIVVSVSVPSFQIISGKLILWPKMGLTYGFSIVNLIFGFYY